MKNKNKGHTLHYHIQRRIGVNPQPFVSRLDIRSIASSQARILGGISSESDYRNRSDADQFTTTRKWAINLKGKPKSRSLTVKTKTNRHLMPHMVSFAK